MGDSKMASGKGKLPLILLLVTLSGIVVAAVALIALGPAPYDGWGAHPPRWTTPFPQNKVADSFDWQEFEPRYRRDDCAVRVETAYDGPPKDMSTVLDFVREGFKRYARRFEPQAGPLTFFPAAPYSYMILTNLCPRRMEIARAAAAFVHKADPRISLTLSDPPGDSVNKETASYQGFWIDGPDYDPASWVLLKKIAHGDPSAFFQLAKKREDADDLTGAYIFFTIAADRLPDGVGKAEAIRRRDGAHAKLKPVEKRYARKIIRIYRANLAKYTDSTK